VPCASAASAINSSSATWVAELLERMVFSER
jgi:hypothetical protein